MRIIHREDQEQREHVELSCDAAFADESDGRDRSAEPDILRTDYQRDRDKILHTKSFRRLSHKTQVFLADNGDTTLEEALKKYSRSEEHTSELQSQR